MNVAVINDSLRVAKKILKEVELYADYNKTREQTLTSDKFSEEFFRISQKDDYEEIYRVAMKNMDFDYVLLDDSIFQFSCRLVDGRVERGTIRYAFYESPRKIITYEEFLLQNDLFIDEDDGAFIDYYEQEKSEAALKNTVTPIRYDYDYGLFQPIHHPISHMHIGHNNQVRIPINKIISPAKFVVFVLRNVYPKLWKEAFYREQFKSLCLAAKNSCSDLDFNHFNEEEKRLLFLS
ncbi:DUF2290 domain-containing protein [Sporosarcina sp. YIM B06819]|uniref:DUF2290 domain-containing protein n=1 Tax=Sporosarcina sp. YIM B06819 TaxID=3081769 RepID=UPI00298C148F|nr:DUF2290 domain-containing protein [Sporosarcina sp. YIM B06819]